MLRKNSNWNGSGGNVFTFLLDFHERKDGCLTSNSCGGDNGPQPARGYVNGKGQSQLLSVEPMRFHLIAQKTAQPKLLSATKP